MAIGLLETKNLKVLVADKTLYQKRKGVFMKHILTIAILLMLSSNSYGDISHINNLIKVCQDAMNGIHVGNSRKEQLAISEACMEAGRLYKCGNQKYGIPINKNISDEYFGLARDLNGAPGYYGSDERCNESTQNIPHSPSYQQSASDFIRQYFNNVKKVPYTQTWNMLSRSMKQKVKSIDRHIAWWDRQVNRVIVENVREVSQNTVQVRLRYYMKNGKTVCSQDFFTLQQNGNSWLIDKQKYKNCK